MSAIKTFLKNILNRPEIILVIIGLIMGSIMIFLVPPNEVPDERDQLLRACEVADGIFYNKVPASETKYDSLFTFLEPRPENEFHCMSGYSPVMYVSSALGIKIGSLIFNDGLSVFYFGRFCNLISYIFLCFLAIRLTPVFKYPFLFCALLPMALFEGMSFSADSFLNGFAFLFFAFLFKLIFEKKEFTKKDLIILTIFSVIAGLCKGHILLFPMILYLFLPRPAENFRFKNKFIYVIPLVFLSLLLCFLWIHNNHVMLNPNIEEYYDSNILFTEPLKVFQIFIDSIKENFSTYINGIIGVFGWLCIYLSPWDYEGALLFFLFSLVVFGEKISLDIRLISLFVLFIFCFSLHYILLLTWTPVNSNIIISIQGRYFISVLPFLFLLFSCPALKISERFKNYFKIFMMLFIIYLLIASCYNMYEHFYLMSEENYYVK